MSDATITQSNLRGTVMVLKRTAGNLPRVGLTFSFSCVQGESGPADNQHHDKPCRGILVLGTQ